MKWLLLTLIVPLTWCATPRSAARTSIPVVKDSIPVCLRKMINERNKEIPPSPPQSVTVYSYEGKTVYYFREGCCDKFNVVYDDSCRLIGAPDGGFTGRGDGKLNGFFSRAKKIRVIEKW
jgi:hypothetical protein